MNDSQKVGGIAALGVVASFMVSLGMLFILLIPTGYATTEIDYSQFVAFLAENQITMYIWYLNILIGSILLVALALALHERVKSGSPPSALAMVQTATAFGLLWGALGIASGLVSIYALNVVVDLFHKDPTQAASTWLMLDAVANGLGGEFEIMGGLWILLISGIALRLEGLPRALNYLGLVVGVSGILTIVTGLNVVLPALDVPETVFVLVIVWLVWLAMVMLRRRPSGVVQKPDALMPHYRTEQNI